MRQREKKNNYNESIFFFSVSWLEFLHVKLILSGFIMLQYHLSYYFSILVPSNSNFLLCVYEYACICIQVFVE